MNIFHCLMGTFHSLMFIFHLVMRDFYYMIFSFIYIMCLFYSVTCGFITWGCDSFIVRSLHFAGGVWSVFRMIRSFHYWVCMPEWMYIFFKHSFRYVFTSCKGFIIGNEFFVMFIFHNMKKPSLRSTFFMEKPSFCFGT